MTARVALTYRDYEALPNDGKRYEIHDGALSVTPAPTSRHQIVLGNLSDVLRAHVKARALGLVLFAPLDVILADTTIVQPDIVYLESSRRSALVERGVEGPPTLAVEILSPSTHTIGRQTKRQLYARYGVPYFWLVDPEALAVEVHVLHGKAYGLVMQASGSEPVDVPPFAGLELVPAELGS